MNELEILSKLIKEKNSIEDKIAEITGRPALIGHTGEYIASIIFNIRLEDAATSPGFDGKFAAGDLLGKTVNVKWYPKKEGLLDINADHLPDYYLVLAGPDTPAVSSRNKTRPWSIYSVFLFDAAETVTKLRSRGARIGAATSMIKDFWTSAEIYPVQRNHVLRITDQQKQMLELFR